MELMVSATMTFYLESEMVTLHSAVQMDLVDSNCLKAKSLTVYMVCSIYSYVNGRITPPILRPWRGSQFHEL